MSATLLKPPRQPRATARQRRIREAYDAALAARRPPSSDIADIIEAVLRAFPGTTITWRDVDTAPTDTADGEAGQ